MSLRSDANRWGGLAQIFHWLMAVLILGAGIAGLFMSGMPNSPQKINVYALHKSIGLSVLALALLRLAWRLADGRPNDVPMPRWQKLVAHAVHGLLYLLMLALPLSGWLYNSAAGFPLQWFRIVQLPSLTGGADPALKAFAHEAHETLFWLLVALLALHVGGALKHQLIDRDGLLARMLPARRGVRPADPVVPTLRKE